MNLNRKRDQQTNPSRTSAKKSLLFAGIILLVVGILVRKMTDFSLIGLLLILLGVGLKTYYIVEAARSGIYKPGRELWLLFSGLALFLGGLYLKRSGSDAWIDPIYLIVIGLTLKVLFVIRFIQIVRKTRNAA